MAAAPDRGRRVGERPKVRTLAPKPPWWVAVWRGTCPRCRSGPIFAGRVAMHDACPVCGLRFSRESGYFTGAMYVSYALSVPILTVLIVALWYGVVPDWPLHWVLLLALAAFAPFMLTIFRYARILFIHFDRFVDP
jgi:uncharacterized protein (DUF983 family)